MAEYSVGMAKVVAALILDSGIMAVVAVMLAFVILDAHAVK